MSLIQSVNIVTKKGTEKERAVKKVLEEVLTQYPCPLFTLNIILEEGTVPHAFPILTMNTRLSDPILVLDGFAHEQFHWFAKSKSSYDNCIEFLKKYQDLGDCNKSGTYPNSFWEHLIVNWNMRNFLSKILSQEQFDFVYSQWTPYPLTEKFVKEHFDTLKVDLEKFDMIYVIKRP